jgi:hypothetical protein
MISYSDYEYLETKKKLKKEIVSEPEFAELSQWISSKYNVCVVNILYRTIDEGLPTLRIYVKYNDEENKFHDEYGQINLKTEKEIIEKFKEILKKNSITKYKTEKIFVFIYSFERVAVEEANSKVSTEDINMLLEKSQIGIIWTINKSYDSAIIFLYSNSQVKNFSISKEKKKLDEEYYQLIKKYDEFNYLEKNKFSLRLDSKENFENKYDGNWGHYFNDN